MVGAQAAQRPLLRGDLLVQDLDQGDARLEAGPPGLGQLEALEDAATAGSE
jgi:hypothetical protein